MILKLQWLVNIYTHPNQIPGYAPDCVSLVDLLHRLHCMVITTMSYQRTNMNGRHVWNVVGENVQQYTVAKNCPRSV